MIKSEDILAVVFIFGFMMTISFPYLAHADATVNGFFPRDFVVAASVKNIKGKKESRNFNNNNKVLTSLLTTLNTAKSDFSFSNKDQNSVDTFSIPKEIVENSKK